MRPPTLVVSAIPVIAGSAVAFYYDGFDFLAALCCALGALFIQIGTNFANDYYDFKKGADTEERLGPKRIFQISNTKPETVKKAMILAFALAFLPGFYIIYLGGWIILLIGILSIISGILYTATRFALAYNGLGDLFVIIFFGLIAVSITSYVQLGFIPSLCYILSFPVGGLATNILVVNNIRDAEGDKKVGKMTLAVRFGKGFCLAEYFLFLIGSYCLLLVIYGTYIPSLYIFIPLLSTPLALKLSKNLLSKSGSDLNPVLADTAKFSAIFCILLSAGIILGK